MAGILQGYRGYAIMNPSAVTPLLSQSEMAVPRICLENLDTPYPYRAARWITNYADGFQEPTCIAPYDATDKRVKLRMV